MSQWHTGFVARSCPWCKEDLARDQRGAVQCPLCGQELRAEDGVELRELDVRYEQLRAYQEERYLQLVSAGSVAAGALTAVVPFMHVAAVLGVPLLVLGHMLALRAMLLGRTLRYLTGARRVFTRWICRFSFLWLALPAYSLAVIPVLGAVVGVLCFAGLSTLIHRYALWNLRRELERRPLALWEKLLLVGLALATVGLLVVVTVFVVLVGWSVTALIDQLGTFGR